jgi:hypothetical protein
MDWLFGRPLPLVLAILSTSAYGQEVVAQDSVMVQTMRSVIFIPYRGGNANRNKTDYYYINGFPASLAQVKAACMTFHASAVVYERYEKMMSHYKRPIMVFLIGEAMALAMLPLFTQPAVYKSQYWQSGIIILAAGSFVYAVGWAAISSSKLRRSIQLYNLSLLIRAGIPTRRMHHRIKYYYGNAFHVF